MAAAGFGARYLLRNQAALKKGLEAIPGGVVREFVSVHIKKHSHPFVFFPFLVISCVKYLKSLRAEDIGLDKCSFTLRARTLAVTSACSPDLRR